jgi:hypothetical protein
MSEQARCVLEAIAYGDDSRITPGDRLRACDQLSRFEDAEAPSGSFHGDLASLEGTQLDGHLDAVLAEEIVSDIFGRRESWPHLAALVDRELERRVRTLAEERYLDMVEAEIERRVGEELARRETGPTPEQIERAAPRPMASADSGDAARHKPRYRPESSLRRRYRSRLLTG